MWICIESFDTFLFWINIGNRKTDGNDEHIISEKVNKLSEDLDAIKVAPNKISSNFKLIFKNKNILPLNTQIIKSS